VSRGVNLRVVALWCACSALLSCTSNTPAASIDPIDSSVQIVALGCSALERHGAGVMIADGRIATVAHVIAGATSVEVRGRHGSGEATVVYFDPVNDLAVLKVDPRLATPMRIGSAKGGDHGTAVVYRESVPTTLRAVVQRSVDIRTADIYGQGEHLRPGYEVTIDVEPGDSGTNVVVGGRSVAIVWATSRRTDERSWAMRTTLLEEHLEDATPVDHGHCT
jgi:S1-C subfamily serine protease